METKSIPTPIEFWDEKYKNTYPNGIINRQFDSDDVHEYAVLFARHHREKQIEAIDDKIHLFYQEGNGIWPIREDLENAYSIDLIK